MTSLHPALQQLLDTIVGLNGPPLESLGLQAVRDHIEVAAKQLGGTGPAVERVLDTKIEVRHGSIKGRLFVPDAQLEALIVYFHGGGWVLGSLDSYDAVARLIAHGTGCAVLLVDYRLAPEFPFPAGLEDSIDSVAWAAKNVKSLVGEELPLVVFGDSAGGNLAAVVTQHARRAGGPRIAAQILVYPCTDSETTSASFREFWSFPLFAGSSMGWFWDFYVPDPEARLLPEVSPVRAASLAGLPPAIVVTTGYDPLRDDGEAYAKALREGGVHVISYRLEALAHAFLFMQGIFDEPARAVKQIGQELTSLLAETA